MLVDQLSFLVGQAGIAGFLQGIALDAGISPRLIICGSILLSCSYLPLI